MQAEFIYDCAPHFVRFEYKFTGKERDSESGLDNFGARYFTSNIGRFMTPDWAARATAVPYAVYGDPQSLNLYGYVRNDPVSNVVVVVDARFRLLMLAANNMVRCRAIGALEIAVVRWFAVALPSRAHAWTSQLPSKSSKPCARWVCRPRLTLWIIVCGQPSH